MPNSTTSTPFRTEIVYNRGTGGYAMYLDGALAGYGASYYDASVALDALIAAERQLRACCDGWSGAPDCDPPIDPDPAPEPWPPAAIVADALLDEANQVLGLSCANCGAVHSIQHCPEIRAMLFRPAAQNCCMSCGDYSATLICPACAESGEGVACAGSDVFDCRALVSVPGAFCRTCGDALTRIDSASHPRILAPHMRAIVMVVALLLGGFVLLACAGDATCSPRNDGSAAAAQCITR